GSSRLTLASRLVLASDRPETLAEALAIPAAGEAVSESVSPRHAMIEGRQVANGVAETAWVALEVLRRVAPEVVAEQRDLQTARGRLDAVLAASVIDAL